MEKKYFTEEQEYITQYAKAMSHPVRVFILDFLAQKKCCYSSDMIDNLPIARSTLSEHLKELKKSGLIQGEINPPFIKYCINQENWQKAKRLFEIFFQN